MKTKRNLKNFNHWIAEIRELAKKHRPKLKAEVGEGEYRVLTKADIAYIFDKRTMKDSFNDDLTPDEALAAELECWEEAIED